MIHEGLGIKVKILVAVLNGSPLQVLGTLAREADSLKKRYLFSLGAALHCQGPGPCSLLCSWHMSQAAHVGSLLGTTSQVTLRLPTNSRASRSPQWLGTCSPNSGPGSLAPWPPGSVPHRDDRCLRVVAVATSGRVPAPPTAHSGLNPRAVTRDRDHQRLPTARARRAAQAAMSRPSARSAADTGPDPRRGGVPPPPHTAPRLSPAPWPSGPPTASARAPPATSGAGERKSHSGIT